MVQYPSRGVTAWKHLHRLYLCCPATGASLAGIRITTSRADGLSTLSDVSANRIVTTVLVRIDASLVLWATYTLEVAGFRGLAGAWVDAAALLEWDLAVVAGALAADLYCAAGELADYILIDTGFACWRKC